MYFRQRRVIFPKNTCADVSGLDQIDLYWSASCEGLEKPFDIQHGYWSSETLNTFTAPHRCVCVCVAEVCCSAAPGVPLPQWPCMSPLCITQIKGPMTSPSSHSVMQSGNGARSVAKCLCAWPCLCMCVCLPCPFSCVKVIMLPSSARPLSKFSKIC